MKKGDACQIFTDDSFTAELRTIESYYADAEEYRKRFESAQEHEKNKHKFRSDVTQKYSHSVTADPILNIPLECVTKASMHVVLGFSNWLVELTISGYKYIEQKAAAASVGTTPVAFRESIEMALKKLNRYKEFLSEEVKDTKSMVTRKNKAAADLLQRTDELEQLRQAIATDFSLTTEAANELFQREQQLETELDQLTKQLETSAEQLVDSTRDLDNDEHVEYMVMLIEQLTITNNTIEECEEFLKNHDGFSRGKIENVLKENGCDRLTYFNGQMVGNHCMQFAKNRDAIYNGILAELDPLIENQDLKAELKAFTTRMNDIVNVWFKLQRVMKSVDKQSEETINEFEENTKLLKDLILKLCTTENPIDGWTPKLPGFPKSHLLFMGHLLQQLRTWGTLGGFDEQNIESAHAIWNQMMRQFGATRGKDLKMKVMREYAFQTAQFVHSNILRIKEESKRKNKYAPRQATPSPQEVIGIADGNVTVSSVDVDDGALVKSINREVALHQELAIAELPSVEVMTHGNTAASNSDDSPPIKVSREDTLIRTCSQCSKRVLGVAFAIHCFESHNMNFCAEVEA